MTNELILKKAIEKAVENGWRTKVAFEFDTYQDHIFEIIFSHDFAKAFSGVWVEGKKYNIILRRELERTGKDGKLYLERL